MSASPKAPSKTYFIQRGSSVQGPFTVTQLNLMRMKNEIGPEELCRPSDSLQFHPLMALFPHMAKFTPKPMEVLKAEARLTEGNSMATPALVCGVIAWFFGAPVLGTFAMIWGIKAWRRARSGMGLLGAIIGAFAIIVRVASLFGIVVYE